ncbi:MHYT domain-containing protein [Nostoc sp. NMS8]|uniref:sensor histidine kinase n=1 Tax=Nostoc sp. NMS8 TaxID=2815392 RepID=UPI0025F9E06F|nr:MHYT domain-containing protein [Nostoc sp. NMS8]MBN3957482.1 PAS domain S-box protein [Nostoc sp. NMS8]
MTATYDIRLVILSFCISIFAAYTALNLAGRIMAVRNLARLFWLAGGAAAMGIGIWSMHFIAMLAYQLPTAVFYDLPVVLLSLMLAIVASGGALFITSYRETTFNLVMGGIVLGSGVGAMHYTGMAAMRLEGTAHYNLLLIIASIVFALCASIIALWLTFRVKGEANPIGKLRKISSSVIMGAAICGMHYTAMNAVCFHPTAETSIKSSSNLIDVSSLAIAIGAATIVILILALIASFITQQISIKLAIKAKALEKIEKSEERFRSLFQNVSNIIATLEGNGQVTYVSSSITNILGCRPEDWMAENLAKLVHPDDQLVAENLFSYTFDNPALDVTAEFRLRHVDGCWRDFEVIVKNLLDDPNVAGIVLTCRDITERKQAEADMRKALEKERELNELKSRFISMASHEFRTPLAVVSSSIGILEDYGHRLNPAQSQKQFQHVQKSINRITQLLDDVLMINQADLNGLEFNPAPVNILQFCHNLVEEIQISAPQHIINLSIIDERKSVSRSWFYLTLCLALKIAKHSSQALRAPGLIFNPYAPLSKDPLLRHKIRQHQNRNNPQLDEKLLQRILSNLLTNAVKYSETGSTIYFKLVLQSESVAFQIQDRGIGIPVEDQALLFESFHRAKNVGRIPGTGLGLAIVRKCVDIHGGEIKVDSHVGIGTTFTVTLPLKQTRKSYETENESIKDLVLAA